jgi:DNA helicase HerA-like ATPase
MDMYDIIVGRDDEDRKKFGTEGTILIGKHYVRMGQSTSLSNNILMDVAKSHVVFICGKRGSGKSYTMGVIAEGMSDLPSEVKNNISVVMLDTMGIYWTMKYANKKEENLLREWDMESKGLNIHIYTPKGYYQAYKDSGIPTDFPFSVKPSELDASDWCMSFEIDQNSEVGVTIERVINELKEIKEDYDIEDILKKVKSEEHIKEEVRIAIINRFLAAEKWGLFDKEGTPIHDLIKGGQVTVLDVSCYATIPGASNIRALVIGLVSEKLFLDRMIARKQEEYDAIKKDTSIIERNEEKKQKDPLVWLIIDEAHEFLPSEGETTATKPLVTILREGRQPGISLILATQQPGKIHTDVMTQSDIVISHRITANYDVKALGMLMQSYMREGLDKQLNYLPRLQGAAIIFDDSNEKMYPMRMRPRMTWHGGSSPIALEKKKAVFTF